MDWGWRLLGPVPNSLGTGQNRQLGQRYSSGSTRAVVLLGLDGGRVESTIGMAALLWINGDGGGGAPLGLSGDSDVAAPHRDGGCDAPQERDEILEPGRQC